MANKKKFNRDGWSNAVTGVGTGKDKGSYAQFTPDGKLPYNTLEHLYESDWIVGKICDEVPYEMTRKWITYDTELDPVKVKEFEDKMNELEVQAKFKEALTWARLYGGSSIMMVVNDGKEPDEPMDKKNVKELLNLIVLDAKTCMPSEWNNDIESKDYGKPEVYQFSTLNGTHKKVHTSRLLKFYGIKVSQRSSRRYRGWGASYITRTLQTITNTQMLDAGISTLVAEAKYDTIYMPNLTELLLAENSDELVNLYANINMQKSITNSVLLDAEMRQERTAYQFGGISEIQKNQLTNLATAIEIPEFILTGRNNGGLNAGQKEQLLAWYDRVLAYQETEMREPLNQLLEVMGKVLNFSTPKEDKKTKKDADNDDKLERVIGFEFTNLYQLNPQELSQVKSQNAQADATYIREGVITADEARKDLMQDKIYGNLDEDKEADDELPDPDDAKAMLEGMAVNNPPQQSQAPQQIEDNKEIPVKEEKEETKPKDETKKKDAERDDSIVSGYLTFKTIEALKKWAKKGLKISTYGRVKK